MKNFVWPKYGMLVLLVCLLAACKGDAAKESAKNDDEETKDERVPVEIASMVRGSIEAVVLSSANLEAEEFVKVYSRTSNQVIELLVEEGVRVKAGQVLVRLENGSQKLQRIKAEARLSKAQREFDRAQDLYNKELIAKDDLNNATYELKQAQVQYAEADRELNYTDIKAPIKGTITNRFVNMGDFVGLNQHLFDIVNFDSIVARVYLPEKNLARLSVGQPARLTSQALEDERFEGAVKRIAPTVDPKTGTIKVTVSVGDTDRLRPGMYVDVAIVLETNNEALLIPKQALIYDNDQVFVFKVDRSGPRVQTRRILLAPTLTDETNVMASAGFSEGDEIVVAGQTGLKDGAFIRILGETDPEVKDTAAALKAEVTLHE